MTGEAVAPNPFVSPVLQAVTRPPPSRDLSRVQRASGSTTGAGKTDLRG